MQKEIKVVQTGDGSHTLYIPSMNETYHSLHGALQESRHVFIKNGLEPLSHHEDSIKILEIGFGTGLNAILTLEFALTIQKDIIYHTLEPYPLSKEIYTALNYGNSFSKELQEFFNRLHQQEEEQVQVYADRFSFRKFYHTLQAHMPDTGYDLVYFDAFAPSKQPEVWHLDNLKKVHDLLQPKGILVTYCAQGQFRRDLKAVGFKVEALAGPPGKKEMTRAVRA